MNLCQLAHTVASTHQPQLIVVKDTVTARLLERAIATFNPKQNILLIPDRERAPYEHVFVDDRISYQRYQTLYQCTQITDAIFITTLQSALDYVPSRSTIELAYTTFSPGQALSLTDLTQKLETIGIRRVSDLQHDGEYQLRGNLMEIKANGHQYRIEWFDDNIDTLWIMDEKTNDYKLYKDAIKLLPQRELVLNQAQRDDLCNYWLSQNEEAKDYPTFKFLASGLPIEGLEDLLPLLYPTQNSLLDFLPSNIAIWLPKAHDEMTVERLNDAQKRYALIKHKQNIIPPLSPTQIINDWRHEKTYHTFTESEIDLGFNCDALVNRIHHLQKTFNRSVVITCQNEARLTQFKAKCSRDELETTIINDLNDANDKNQVYLLIGDCYWPHEYDQYFIIADYVLFKKTPKNTEKKINAFAELSLQPKEYVVHENHGIGQYLGLVSINDQEFMEIIYKNAAKIFLSVDQFHLISRYHVQESVVIDEINSTHWQKTCRKAKAMTYDYAAEILKVSAKRELLTGDAIPCPNEYSTFKAEFPYTETEDQASAIKATIHDLAQPVPMDRLICGDVGFGKTEIAIRAAFITAMNQKQVLFLAPTTLLASQHYANFKARFAQWPVTISLLTSQTKSKQLINQIAEGSVDIIITTHVVLKTALQYKDLALIIIDEEHRFGVKDKEFIKKFHPNIHYLSMSATPIPRSLNMALSSLRSISLIASPPVQRTQVITEVLRHNDEIIKAAIERELYRGGQVFMIHNDVASIEKVVDYWRQQSPHIIADYIHGQMTQFEQDEKMHAFAEHHVNVLVATTIIESGIDIPNANTMIVLRADKFGLAQLHQLRGRVGRSHRQAYCYFMTPDPKLLKKNALSRLNAIGALSSLGAGYQLAVHDLEIRGTGSILGEQQSGMIKGVGYELYLSMLKQACQTLSATEEATPPIQIQTFYPQLIPADYIKDTNQRLSLYQAIAKADTETLNQIEEDMSIHHGALPFQTECLLQTRHLANALQAIGCTKFSVNKQEAIGVFEPNNEGQHSHLLQLFQANPNISMGAQQQMVIRYPEDIQTLQPNRLNDYLLLLFGAQSN